MDNLYASVVVNRNVAAIDKIFSYRIPPALQEQVVQGVLVQIPFGHQVLEGIVIEITAVGQVDDAKTKDILAVISQYPLFNQELLDLSLWLANYYLCNRVTALQAMLPAGLQLTGYLPQALKSKYYYLAENWQVYPATVKQKLILDYLQHHPGAEVHQLLEQTGCSVAVLKNLENKQVVLAQLQQVTWNEEHTLVADQKVLTQDQQRVYTALKDNMAGAKKPVLLHGITGSGKTEIYLKVIRDVIAKGQQCIFLVPEIALTGQMVDFFRNCFPDQVAVLHSGLTGTERRKAWLGISQGQFALVIGARSAIFAPTPQLGLVIMDEEHETSYKQDNYPCFHTREVALERCRNTAAQLILGSATPGVESYYLAQKGDYLLLQLTGRYHQPLLPQVEVVDMRVELRNGNRSVFSFLLQDLIGDRLAKKEQVILFLNRRGYNTFVSCRSCGQAIQCPHCSIAMSWHKDKKALECHYCGAVRKVPDICPHCGSKAIRHFGVGTEKIEEEVKTLFPQARVGRLDRDIAAQRGAYDRVYRQMLNREIDVLVGTQMIAKGLDFPAVTLVGAVAADTMLNLPDWRSGEKTFQLLTQVIGRGGRRTTQGEAVIQCYTPDSAVILHAQNQDYEGFYNDEINFREKMGYPPFCYLIKLLLTGPVLTPLIDGCKSLAQYIAYNFSEQVTVCGPAAAPLEKIKDRYRYQMILKSQDSQILKEAVQDSWQKCLEKNLIKKDILLHIDVDPQNMM